MNSSKPLLYSVLNLLLRVCTACFIAVIKRESQKVKNAVENHANTFFFFKLLINNYQVSSK